MPRYDGLRCLLILVTFLATSNIGNGAVVVTSGTIKVYAESLGTTSSAPFPEPSYVRKRTSEIIALPTNDSSTQSSTWGYGGGGTSTSYIESLSGAILFSADSSVKKMFTPSGGELGQAYVDFYIFFTITNTPAIFMASSHGNLSGSGGGSGTEFYLKMNGVFDPLIKISLGGSDFDNLTYQLDPGSYELKGATQAYTGTNPNPNWTSQASASFSVVPEVSCASLSVVTFVLSIGFLLYKRRTNLNYE